MRSRDNRRGQGKVAEKATGQSGVAPFPRIAERLKSQQKAQADLLVNERKFDVSRAANKN